MKRIIAVLLLLTTSAAAQITPPGAYLTRHGSVTPTHCATWYDSAHVQDGGLCTGLTWPASADLVISNGTNTPAGLAPVNGDCVFASGGAWTAGSCVPSDTAFVDVAQTFTMSQRNAVQTLTLSSSTATPDFDTGNNFTLTLSSACPCVFANPSTTPVAGQSGVITIIQDGTGSRTIVSWGSDYTYQGGTAMIVQSTGPNNRDYLSYYVDDSSHIVITTAALNATH